MNRELYGSGQEVEVKRATHDGYIWANARVLVDDGVAVHVHIHGYRGPVAISHADVRKSGEDKA